MSIIQQLRPESNLWLLTVSLFLAGFGCSVFVTGSASPYFAPTMVLMILCMALMLSPGLKEGWSIPRSGTMVCLTLFWIWTILSIFWSSIPYISILFGFILSLLPALTLSLTVGSDSDKAYGRIKTHMLAMYLIWIGMALWAMVQFFFLYDVHRSRIHHPMLNPNNFAAFINLGLLPAMAFFFAVKQRNTIIITGFLVALLIAALTVTQSRGGFLAFLICSAFLIPAACIRRPFPYMRLAILILILTLIPMILHARVVDFFEYLPGSKKASGILSTQNLLHMSSTHNRFDIWLSTWEMIKAHPIFGIGLATFFFHFPPYRSAADTSDGFFAHMDPAQFWLEMGILSPILFYALLIAVFIRTVKALRMGWGDHILRLEIIGPFCGMLAVVGHAHISFHLYMPTILIPMACMLAYWYNATERSLCPKPIKKKGKAKKETENVKSERFHIKLPEQRRKLYTSALGLIVFLLILWPIRATTGALLLDRANELALSGKLHEADKVLDIAQYVSPYIYPRYHDYRARIRIHPLWESADRMSKEEIQTLFDEAIIHLDRAEKMNPFFADIYDVRARLYFAVDGILMEDGKAQAEKILKKALAVNPLSVQSRIGLANIYQNRGEIRKAHDLLADFMDYPRARGKNDIEYILMLARLKRQLGDKQGYQLYMREALMRSNIYEAQTGIKYLTRDP